MRKNELTPEEARVYNALPAGHKNAVKRGELAARLGLEDREIREIIESLTEKRHTVCNLMDGKGYFIPETEEEYLAYEKIINSYKCKFQRKEYGIRTARINKFGLGRADVRRGGKRPRKRFAKNMEAINE